MMVSAVHAGEGMQFRIAPNNESTKMRKYLLNGQDEIFASGEIDEGATERFKSFVRRNQISDAIVLFDSVGGSLVESLKLGAAIRNLEFDTGIGSYGENGDRDYKGLCASACVYAFVGGKYRYYHGKNEKLGLHQFYAPDSNQNDMGDTQLISSMLISYLQFMDVDPRAFIVASTTRGDSMYWLSSEQANLLAISNNGQEATTAEIKIAAGFPYLKLEQVSKDATARVLFNCKDGKVILIMAGIVTTASRSNELRKWLTKSYLEVDQSTEFLVSNSQSDTLVSQDTLWLMRANPKFTDLLKIAEADKLGLWTEDGGNMRWGAMMDLIPVKQKYINFLKQCIG